MESALYAASREERAREIKRALPTTKVDDFGVSTIVKLLCEIAERD